MTVGVLLLSGHTVCSDPTCGAYPIVCLCCALAAMWVTNHQNPCTAACPPPPSLASISASLYILTPHPCLLLSHLVSQLCKQVRLLFEMLNLDPWCYYPLQVQILSSAYTSLRTAKCLLPPPHITVSTAPVEVRPCTALHSTALHLTSPHLL